MTDEVKKNPFIPPHDVVSRPCEAKDILRILEDGARLYELCEQGNGLHEAGYAVAHPQITMADPLRFFVTRSGEVVINPEVTRHTGHKVEKIEGCLSFPLRHPSPVMRWNKCEVKYLTWPDDFPDEKEPTWDDLVEKEEALSKIEAQIYQHEIDHFDGIYMK